MPGISLHFALRKRALRDHARAAIGVDLAQRALRTAMGDCPAFRGDAPTLFVAEGLLMYMPLDAVAALFAQIAAASSDSQVAFTWLEPQADGLPNFRQRSRLVDFWLRLRGEPFLSGMPRAELGRFLGAAGFVMDYVNDSVDLLGEAQRAALGPEGLPIDGEYICFARTDPSLIDCYRLRIQPVAATD